jgi:hypothetical protein
MAIKRRARKKSSKELASADFKRRTKSERAIRRRAHAATERLPKRRREFVLDLVGHAWVSQFLSDDDDAAFEKESRRRQKLRQQFLSEATNPLELHLFASEFNCDEGPGPIYMIVTHPHCDAGTALWLYWENDPYCWQAYRTAQDADGEERTWVRIMRAIERRIRRDDFATAKVPFDPEPWVTDRYADAEWVVHDIPKEMYRPIEAGKPKKRK